MATPALPPLTIFVVDDNPVDVHLIKWVLDAHELPYDLQVIDNGDHALAVVDQLAQQEHLRSPIIVLLDLHLPQRDGKEILRHIKAIPQGADIRVVIVTGSADPRERAETLALGADGYFVKPFHLTPFMQLGDLIKAVAVGSTSWGAPQRAPLTTPGRGPGGSYPRRPETSGRGKRAYLMSKDTRT